jgi:flagellar assembly factor FliW
MGTGAYVDDVFTLNTSGSSIPSSNLLDIAIKTPELAFLLADPFIFFPDYSINIEDSHIGEKIAIYVIVALNEDFKLSTANLIAPIVIDIESKKAFQIVLEDSPYTTRHYLFEDEISNSALVG